MSHPDEPRFNYPPCPTCGGKQVRMSATVANPICPVCMLDQAKFKALGIPKEVLEEDTPAAIAREYEQRKGRMPVYLEVKRITIVRSGTDKVILHVGLPEGCYPFKGDASVTMDVAQGNGVAYCLDHFPGVPIEDLTHLKEG